MKSFKEKGWNCSEKTYADIDGETYVSPEELVNIKNEYEQTLIDILKSDKEIPGVSFYVRFCDVPDRISYVAGHRMSSNPSTIMTLLESHPELAEDVIKVIDAQIAEMDEIEIRTTYEYNEEIFEDSDFYIKRRECVKNILLEIKENLLKKELSKKNAEKERLIEEGYELDKEIAEKDTKGTSIGEE